ncbi:MAG: polyphosphate polymerase domain-containing protein [Lachnospiraceae bacterium]|nr:polyphosphate polymerase domain-containing protein [Lachnospiraceae bacterium]
MEYDKLKYRHEFKYIVTETQCAILKARIQPLMRLDQHAGSDGQYSIRSLYFDDDQDRCYYENRDGTDPREKYRIRIYDRSKDYIRLECKRKERGKTQKTSTPISVDLAHSLMERQDLCVDKLPPPARKMILMGLHPVIIVEYARIPFEYSMGNVRVTFDMGISFSASPSGFFEENIPRRPLMPKGLHIMEVKYDEFLPDFIYRALNLGTLRQTTFSKYYLCRESSF